MNLITITIEHRKDLNISIIFNIYGDGLYKISLFYDEYWNTLHSKHSTCHTYGTLLIYFLSIITESIATLYSLTTTIYKTYYAIQTLSDRIALS